MAVTIEVKVENYRLSTYAIFIKLQETTDDYMLIHGYTGALDIASKELVDYLRSGNIDINNSPFSKETVKNLIERGYITHKTISEERDEVKKRANLFHRRAKLFKVYTILVTYDCNFRCPYCFENTISEKGNCWTRKTMTKEMVDKLYLAIRQIEPQKELVNKKIALYGGEPLLAENKEIVQYIVDKGKEMGFSFKAVTNGFELEHYKNLLNPECIDSLQITIDGSREIHDKRRYHYKNGDSFNVIMDNIQMALDLDVAISVRINVDSQNLLELNKLKKLFEERGFYNYKRFSVSSAQVAGSEQEEQNGTLLNRITYLSETFSIPNSQDPIIQCQDYGLTRNLSNAIFRRGEISLNSTFCSAQSGGLIMDPYGNIFSCWECVGKKDHIVGNYENGLVWNDENLEKWQGRNIGVLPQCSKCKYAFLCRGNCLGHILHNGGNFTSSRCESFPAALEFIANKIYHVYTQSINKKQ